MAERIIESVDKTPTPLRMVLGSQALDATITRLKERITDYETQTELAASTDVVEWRRTGYYYTEMDETYLE